MASQGTSRAPEGAKKPDPAEQQRNRERTSLELQRTKLRNDISTSTNERYRQMLEAALVDIEKKLAQR